MDPDTPQRWTFARDPRYAPLLRPFGVHGDDDAFVELDDERLLVRFGRWAVSTPVRNLAGAQVTGPFSAPKVLGPHLSFADRGITFGTATETGTCIRFHVPVPGIEPLGVLRHPGLTVTVEDPVSLAEAVEQRAAAERTNGFRRSELPDRPGTAERAGALLRYPWGLAVNTARYLWHAADVERSHADGDGSDLPPELPAELVDAHLKAASEGDGPLLHRTFRVRVRGCGRDAAALIDRITGDLDRAAPSEVATFRKERGRIGGMAVGDEYRVRMPAPWDGPVRVVHRDRTSFRFATLDGHMEAGQIEFSARDDGGDVEFLIEAWSRPGDRAAAIAIDRIGVGKEIQLHMWTQFCLSVVSIAGGRRDGPVRVHTRRVERPFRQALPRTPRP
jgi:Domain of unknown function (DUF1990)